MLHENTESCRLSCITAVYDDVTVEVMSATGGAGEEWSIKKFQGFEYPKRKVTITSRKNDD